MVDRDINTSPINREGTTITITVMVTTTATTTITAATVTSITTTTTNTTEDVRQEETTHGGMMGTTMTTRETALKVDPEITTDHTGTITGANRQIETIDASNRTTEKQSASTTRTPPVQTGDNKMVHHKSTL